MPILPDMTDDQLAALAEISEQDRVESQRFERRYATDVAQAAINAETEEERARRENQTTV